MNLTKHWIAEDFHDQLDLLKSGALEITETLLEIIKPTFARPSIGIG